MSQASEHLLLLPPVFDDDVGSCLEQYIIDNGHNGQCGRNAKREEYGSMESKSKQMDSLYSIANSLESRVELMLRQVDDVEAKVSLCTQL